MITNWFSGRFYNFAALRANLKTARASRIWQLQLILHWVGLYPHERETAQCAKVSCNGAYR